MNERTVEIKERIKRIRRVLSIKLSLLFVFSVLALVGFALAGDDMRLFISSVVLFGVCVSQIIIIMRTKTVKIFGKERRGVIVDKKTSSRIFEERGIGRFGINEPREFEHGRVRVLVGSIYIKEEDGSVFSIDELDEDRLSFFEVGDRVVIFKGAKFPLVTNEPPSREKWLCPICGTVSPDGTDCHECKFPF